MLLYLWVNNYRHIQKTGFNLSSLYHFSFDIDHMQGKEIKGKLKCKSVKRPKIFHKDIADIMAVIGENGAGKSTILEILVSNILSKPNFFFDGFIVTDKFIFNRKGIEFGNSVEKIRSLRLKEVSNVDLVNYSRDFYQKKVDENSVQDYYHGQIATTYLNNLSIIHYSPLLNIERIANIEGLAGSSRVHETDYWHYFDYTTENCIVNDYNAISIDSPSAISGESELLAHKSAESQRNLEFLSNDIFKALPFKNRIGHVYIRLNDFYERFWESVDGFFKADDQTHGLIGAVIDAIKLKDYKQNDPFKELESNLYLSFLYGALKYEYSYNTHFGSRGKSNAIQEAINLFLQTTKGTRIHKTALRNFLKAANFSRDHSVVLFQRIQKLLEFIMEHPKIIQRGKYSFAFSTSESEAIADFLKLYYKDFVLWEGERAQSFIFHVFSFQYEGLSSGERNLLSMLSRIKHAADTLPDTQTDIVFLLDEPEVTLHPQWQTSFISLLNDNLPLMFPGKKLQIIITSHSPILISDLPLKNILFLEKDDETGLCKVSRLKNIRNTFGANIHALYADAFFLREKGGAMGAFSKRIITDVISELNKKDPKDARHLRQVIEMVGEPLVQNQLWDLFFSKFPEEKIDNIDERIQFLEQRLAESKQIKEQTK